MKMIRRLLIWLHFVIGIGAMAGGMVAILNPQKPLGMPTEALQNSPFSDYLIPGIILFAVIGLGNLFSASMLLKKSKWQAYISGVTGGALVVWIIVQCIMIQIVAFLHILFFGFGMIEGLLATFILFEQKKFPANIVIKVFSKIRTIFLRKEQ